MMRVVISAICLSLPCPNTHNYKETRNKRKKNAVVSHLRISPTLPKKQYTKWAGKRAANRCFPLVVLQRGNGARHVAN